VGYQHSRGSSSGILPQHHTDHNQEDFNSVPLYYILSPLSSCGDGGNELMIGVKKISAPLSSRSRAGHAMDVFTAASVICHRSRC